MGGADVPPLGATGTAIRAERAVLAVLLVHGQYLKQLRDDKPTIEAPGTWGLFGGMVERGEPATRTESHLGAGSDSPRGGWCAASRMTR